MARTLCRWPSCTAWAVHLAHGCATGSGRAPPTGPIRTIERMGDTHSVVSLMQARLRSGTFLGAHRRVDVSQVTQMRT
jgi:hypothetical protein